ncbi:HIT domain-containing protein [Candidatus Saccharibacteria bacterium]|nr:HIT domain-containing protein [Candidatus Saccharibacteria bacterium]
MSDSIFTKIIKGEIPCHKVYEDDKTLAFMEINPIQPGHVLVISKKQIHLWNLPDEDYKAVMATVKKVANRINDILKPKRIGLQVVGVHIPDHAHVHVFPFGNMNEYRAVTYQASDKELAKIAKKLRF